MSLRRRASKMNNTLDIITGSKLGKRHIVEDILGEGGFGVVAKCQNMCTGRTEAVKVNRCEPDDMYQAFVEISLLKRLRCLNADTCNIVEWNGYFFHEENICMTFEVLDVSLDTYLTQRGNPGLPVTEIRPVLHQVATALSHLHSIGVVHLDLKPENIMVVDRTQQPVRVKIIDFGLSGLLSEIKQGLRQGSTWYMAPEMILAAPLNETLDMWSLGVIAAELAMGCPLYPGNIDYDVLSYIVETQGHGCHPEGRRNSRLSCLDDIGHRMSMLHLDAGQRVKAREALQHPFFAPGVQRKEDAQTVDLSEVRVQHPATFNLNEHLKAKMGMLLCACYNFIFLDSFIDLFL
uniref:Protein kinase domain-containing protein n=1 Tax=Stegastes partitus TaxID=144197 RepID=A0A3B5A6A4_9TELE